MVYNWLSLDSKDLSINPIDFNNFYDNSSLSCLLNCQNRYACEESTWDTSNVDIDSNQTLSNVSFCFSGADAGDNADLQFSQSMYEYDIYCDGYNGFESYVNPSNISINSDLICRGGRSCWDQDIFGGDTVKCFGQKTCSNGIHSDMKNAYCFGEHSCGDQWFHNLNFLYAFGSDTLIYSIINSTGNMDNPKTLIIVMNGFSSGRDLNISCNGRDTCIMYYFSGVSDNFYVNCNQNATCLMYKDSYEWIQMYVDTTIAPSMLPTMEPMVETTNDVTVTVETVETTLSEGDITTTETEDTDNGERINVFDIKARIFIIVLISAWLAL